MNISEAVEVLKRIKKDIAELNYGKVADKSLNTAIQVMQEYEKEEAVFPEKKDIADKCWNIGDAEEKWTDIGYNQCLDEVRPIFANLQAKCAELEARPTLSREKVEEILQGWSLSIGAKQKIADKIMDLVVDLAETGLHDVVNENNKLKQRIKELEEASISKGLLRERTNYQQLQAKCKELEEGILAITESEQQLQAKCERYEQALRELKRGSCWCEIAIGNPMAKTHSKGCLLAQQALNTSEPKCSEKPKIEPLETKYRNGETIELHDGRMKWDMAYKINEIIEVLNELDRTRD